MRAVLLTAVLLFVPLASLADELPVVIRPTDRVRIETVPVNERVPMPLRGKFVGSITDFNSDKLTVVLDGGPTAIVHRDLVAGLEVGVDRGSRGKHALIGTGVAILIGGALGFASGSDNPDFMEFSRGEGALAGAILSAPIGALIGAAMPAGMSWKTVPLEQVEWTPPSTVR